MPEAVRPAPSYDSQGRVHKITGEQATRYRPNALNQRIRKTHASGQATDTVYGEDEMAAGLASYPLGHYSPGSSQSTEYLYLPTATGPMPIAVQLAQPVSSATDLHPCPSALCSAAPRTRSAASVVPTAPSICAAHPANA